jgi:hypothetical protein
MRVVLAPSGATDLPSPRSVVARPTGVAPSACVLLLAMLGSDTPVGSLLVDQDSAFARVHAVGLRLPPENAKEVAQELLWSAARELPALRRGSALLADPATAADAETLQSLGFAPVNESGPLLALVDRRDPSEPAGFSHATLRVSAIEQSLDFWSLLHFAPTRVFTASGARCAWLSAPWCELSIELIEVPEVVLRQMPPSLLTPSADALGPAHLCLDVTALGVALPSTLELLQRRSAARFGRTLCVLMPPHQQMMADLVAEVAVVRAPDGVELRLTHQSAVLEREMEVDWRRLRQ